MALTAKQLRIVDALFQYPSMTAVADALGVNRRTIAAQLQRPEVQEELAARRERMIEAACDGLRDAAQNAVAITRSIMEDPENAPQVRINAAGSVLQYALRYCDQVDIEKRIAALERAAGMEK